MEGHVGVAWALILAGAANSSARGDDASGSDAPGGGGRGGSGHVDGDVVRRDTCGGVCGLFSNARDLRPRLLAHGEHCLATQRAFAYTYLLSSAGLLATTAPPPSSSPPPPPGGLRARAAAPCEFPTAYLESLRDIREGNNGADGGPSRRCLSSRSPISRLRGRRPPGGPSGRRAYEIPPRPLARLGALRDLWELVASFAGVETGRRLRNARECAAHLEALVLEEKEQEEEAAVSSTSLAKTGYASRKRGSRGGGSSDSSSSPGGGDEPSSSSSSPPPSTAESPASKTSSSQETASAFSGSPAAPTMWSPLVVRSASISQGGGLF